MMTIVRFRDIKIGPISSPADRVVWTVPNTQKELDDTKRVIQIRISHYRKTHWPKEKGQKTIYKTYTYI